MSRALHSNIVYTAYRGTLECHVPALFASDSHRIRCSSDANPKTIHRRVRRKPCNLGGFRTDTCRLSPGAPLCTCRASVGVNLFAFCVYRSSVARPTEQRKGNRCADISSQRFMEKTALKLHLKVPTRYNIVVRKWAEDPARARLPGTCECDAGNAHS